MLPPASPFGSQWTLRCPPLSGRERPIQVGWGKGQGSKPWHGPPPSLCWDSWPRGAWLRDAPSPQAGELRLTEAATLFPSPRLPSLCSGTQVLSCQGTVALKERQKLNTSLISVPLSARLRSVICLALRGAGCREGSADAFLMRLMMSWRWWAGGLSLLFFCAVK